jgi:hypothetical protein
VDGFYLYALFVGWSGRVSSLGSSFLWVLDLMVDDMYEFIDGMKYEYEYEE